VHILSRGARRIRTAAAVLAAAAAVSLLAGCNPSKKAASEGSPSPAARPLTREEYVNQAAVLCSVSKGKTRAAPATAADYVAAIRAEIAELKDLQTKLGALEPPAADKKKLQDEFLGPKASTIKVFEDALPDVEKAAATGDLDATKKAFTPAAQRSIDLASGAAAFLTSYGLEACS
jgi:hypothetical protein